MTGLRCTTVSGIANVRRTEKLNVESLNTATARVVMGATRFRSSSSHAPSADHHPQAGQGHGRHPQQRPSRAPCFRFSKHAILPLLLRDGCDAVHGRGPRLPTRQNGRIGLWPVGLWGRARGRRARAGARVNAPLVQCQRRDRRPNLRPDAGCACRRADRPPTRGAAVPGRPLMSILLLQHAHPFPSHVRQEHLMADSRTSSKHHRRRARRRPETEHPRHLGRRHRNHEPQLLQRRADGISHAEHRSHRDTKECGSPIHTASRAARRAARRSSPGSPAIAPASRKSAPPEPPSGSRPKTRPSPSCSRTTAMRRANSARTTSAIATSFCRRLHGFDEFFGNLYHLNAEEEPELPTGRARRIFPSSTTKYRPRGVLHCWATETDDDTVDVRFGRVGKQKIQDTGPLTKKRMETCDDEFADAAIDFHEAAARPPARHSSAG